jgi:hypothetical protein
MSLRDLLLCVAFAVVLRLDDFERVDCRDASWNANLTLRACVSRISDRMNLSENAAYISASLSGYEAS